MNKPIVCCLAISFAFLAHGPIQGAQSPEKALRVSIVINPYTGDRSSPETVEGPWILANSGIEGRLRQNGIDLKLSQPITLTPQEKREYGQWNRFGMANGHLGESVARELLHILSETIPMVFPRMLLITWS